MNTKELLNALEKVKPGISSKSSSEGMSYFYFSGTDVITYNDKISIQHPFETDFNLFVKANDFYKIISKLSTEEINVVEKNNKLNITGKKIKSSLATIQDNEVSERIKSLSKSLSKVEWQELPKNFNESILLCSFTASTQISAGTLICVYLKENICVASDNSRISYATLDSEIDEMFIQASEIKNLVSISPTKYAITQSWLHFKNEDGCVFSIRKIEGEFPDFMSLFDFEGIKIDLPKEIIEGIDIASILADVNDKAINIKIAKNAVILSAKSDGGKIMHRSKIDYDKEEINFSINPDFIKEMMKHNSHVSIGEGKAKLQTESFSLLTAFYN
jgi:DNA polymerase III sliding clamp (beta) subunit (PCNA family)